MLLISFVNASYFEIKRIEKNIFFLYDSLRCSSYQPRCVSHETKRSQQNAGSWKTLNFSSNKVEEQKGWI